MSTFRSFHDDVVSRARTDEDFRRSLLKEGEDAMADGEFDVGLRLVQDYFQAADYLPDQAKGHGLKESEVRDLFNSEKNAGSWKLYDVMAGMLQHERLCLVTRRRLKAGRRPVS
jgi:hypothetical protein